MLYGRHRGAIAEHKPARYDGHPRIGARASMPSRAPAAFISLFSLFAALPVAAQAQDWPTRGAIRFIVPYPAGGSTDVGARVIAERLSRALGQQIVVENKSGSSGAIGMDFVAKS